MGDGLTEKAWNCLVGCVVSLEKYVDYIIVGLMGVLLCLVLFGVIASMRGVR